MTCPYLEYKREGEDRSFDHERPYCWIAGSDESSFVPPVKADVCNDRFDFDHREHCDRFRDHVEARADGDDD